ncbi:MAG: PKD domain-containing protein [Muribaculaceae bacterium]|jgi:hypothetical protein|nr:PKD domain-containing protein [Muribaculaceae bacterium]
MNRFILSLKSVLIVAAIAVSCIASAKSPFISKIYDFCPAPGQFVNVLPKYESGDTKESIIAKVSTRLCCDTADATTVSLGAYGGYIVFGFDHTVVNTHNYDFKILGNAFASADATLGYPGGSCEPGILMVSFDANANGEPDDAWYEIAGSDYSKSSTVHNYSITYVRSNENQPKIADPVNKEITDTTYTPWSDNQGNSGHIYRNSAHAQSYFPLWLSTDTLSFTGTKLADNAENRSVGTAYSYVLRMLDWGYVDNLPNKMDPGLKIDWAVDANGNSVNLPGINFVKVYTALNQYCGWIGETSTEVTGAADLHVDASAVTSATEEGQIKPYFDHTADELVIPDGGNFSVFNLQGMKVLSGNSQHVSLQNIANGIYIVRNNGITVKFTK